jgi:hypothetical protein
MVFEGKVYTNVMFGKSFFLANLGKYISSSGVKSLNAYRLHWTFCVSVTVAFQFRCQSTISSTARREEGFVSSWRVSISKKMDGILWSVWVQYRFRRGFLHSTPQGMLLKIT